MTTEITPNVLPEKHPYSISGFKSFTGMEGLGFNLNLLENGKMVAYVVDDASGGPYLFHWSTKVAEERFYAFLKTLPKYEYFGVTLNVDTDVFLGQLVDWSENEKKFKRMCKTKTLYTLNSDSPDDYRVMDIPFSERISVSLKHLHNDNLKEIINLRYI